MRQSFTVTLCLVMVPYLLGCSGEQADTAKPDAAKVVSAEQLRAEHKENQQAFADRYLTKQLVVTGKAHGVTSQTLYEKGKWDIVLTGKDADPNDFPWIGCLVPEELVPRFAVVKVGDQVTIEGTCFKCTKSGIMLKECKLRAHKPVESKP